MFRLDLNRIDVRRKVLAVTDDNQLDEIFKRNAKCRVYTLRKKAVAIVADSLGRFYLSLLPLLEVEINRLVYAHYGLTEEEIALVEVPQP